MYKAMKIRLLPTKDQEEKMLKTINVCRFVWNWGLSYRNNFYKETGKSIKGRQIRSEFTKFKKTEGFEWINEVSSKAYENEFDKLDVAFDRFFKKISKYPKFKKKKEQRKSFYCRNDSFNFNFTNNTCSIERVGRVKFKSDRKIPKIKKYSNITCSFDGKYWILSFGLEVEKQDTPLTNETIGIDLGIKTLMTLSNGIIVNNINKSKKVKELEKKLKRLQRQCSRKYKMNKEGNKFKKTQNIIKLEKEIAILHRRLTNIRTNEIHQATNKLIKSIPKTIVIEDLNVKGMMKNRKLAKSVMDCKFYEIRRQIEYKSKYYGIEVIIADRWFPSSKTCNCCGNIDRDLKISDRIYKCSCGYVEDRDLNASYNLRDYGVNLTRK